ncbi:hypothetical protein [Allomuricauda sp. SCSIO 64092]|nr:hypothetical protein [Muricauda sp. SCSIO 64092]
MDNTIYIILGGLALVYFVVLFYNKRNTRKRKSRKFMEGKRRHEK